MMQTRRWRSAAIATAAALSVAVSTLARGNYLIGSLITVAILGVGMLVSPLLFPRGPGWTAGQQIAQTRGVPLILWKSGCGYSIRLRLALRAAGRRAVWVDIWADQEAAAAIREFNQGNETTPTVITAGGVRTNPDPSWVIAQFETS